MLIILPALSAIAALVSLLTSVSTPNYVWSWKLAIIASEFGHWLVLLPLGLAVAAGFNLTGVTRGFTLICCAVAVVGFLRPWFLAHGLAKKLPPGLDAAFGGHPPACELDYGRLFGGSRPPRAAMRTEIFARLDGQELKLDFYTPGARKDAHGISRPCVVVIHGGGWDSGDRTQLAGWNDRLAARGYAVAAVSYRLAPQWIWPAQREDVLAAIAWLKNHARELGIDPTRLVLFGRSAGGQLATAVGYGADDPAIRGIIALYAPHDMPFAWSVSSPDDALNSIKLMSQFFGGPPDTPERAARYASASGQLLARAGSPSTLLIHGRPDTLAWHRHSERLTVRLRELRVPHHYLELPWATHGFDFNPDGPAGQLTDCALGQFLATVTR